LLAPGDEREGDSGIDRPEHERRHGGRTKLRAAAPDAARGQHERDEQQRGERDPDEHERRRRHVPHADLDEQVRGAPDGGEQRDREEVPAAHGASSGTVARRRRSRTLPVPSATPPRINASPASASGRTLSPRIRAPYATAIGGTRYVTRIAFEAPAPTIRP